MQLLPFGPRYKEMNDRCRVDTKIIATQNFATKLLSNFENCHIISRSFGKILQMTLAKFREIVQKISHNFAKQRKLTEKIENKHVNFMGWIQVTF
jgi:hypothetical protein